MATTLDSHACRNITDSYQSPPMTSQKEGDASNVYSSRYWQNSSVIANHNYTETYLESQSDENGHFSDFSHGINGLGSKSFTSMNKNLESLPNCRDVRQNFPQNDFFQNNQNYFNGNYIGNSHESRSSPNQHYPIYQTHLTDDIPLTNKATNLLSSVEGGVANSYFTDFNSIRSLNSAFQTNSSHWSAQVGNDGADNFVSFAAMPDNITSNSQTFGCNRIHDFGTTQQNGGLSCNSELNFF